jgi:hypothetical protein
VLRLAAEARQTVTVRSGSQHAVIEVDATPRWFDVPFAAPAADIVNNVGSVLTPDGFGADRGFLEPDSGQFDEPTDVFAWCGAAVLLRGAYLARTGLLDEQLFLYYEDFELSWRGAKCGWRYRYVPTSVVRHVHSATTVSGSKLARYFDDRNRLLVLARHGSIRRATRTAGRFLLVTESYLLRDVVAPLLHGHRPRATAVAGRLRSFGGFAWRLPSVLARRRRDRRLVAGATDRG